jgi:hypothetical protein
MVFFNILFLKFRMVDWVFDKTRICNIHKIELYSLWSVNFTKCISSSNRIVHAHILILLFRSNIVRILEKVKSFVWFWLFQSIDGHDFILGHNLIPICMFDGWAIWKRVTLGATDSAKRDRRCHPGLGHRHNDRRDGRACGLYSGFRHLYVCCRYLGCFLGISVLAHGSDDVSRGCRLAAVRVEEFDSREHHQTRMANEPAPSSPAKRCLCADGDSGATPEC